MEGSQGHPVFHSAHKSLVCNCLLIFIVTNNGQTNGHKHWIVSQWQMSFRAGHSVQTALIELSKIIATALDKSKFLAKVFIDLSLRLCQLYSVAGHLKRSSV